MRIRRLLFFFSVCSSIRMERSVDKSDSILFIIIGRRKFWECLKLFFVSTDVIVEERECNFA